MITKTFQILLLVAVLTYFSSLYLLLRRKKLLLRYSLLWLLVGLIMLVMAAFPRLLNSIASLLGIYAPVNALFAILAFFGLIMLVYLSSIISQQEIKIKKLSQKMAILDEAVRTTCEAQHEQKENV